MKTSLITLFVGAIMLTSCINTEIEVFPSAKEFKSIDFNNPPAKFQTAINTITEASKHALYVNEGGAVDYNPKVLREYGLPEDIIEMMRNELRTNVWENGFKELVEKGITTSEEIVISSKKSNGIIPYDADDFITIEQTSSK